MQFLPIAILISFLVSSCSLPLIMQETEAVEEVVEEALEIEGAVQKAQGPVQPAPQFDATKALVPGKANAF